ncbi:2-amino-4-hydroxy-6-hydroxymethyldihydropteridine diphosphokinase [Spelaeicoccus albus]|uniref:2-amino-4-hydroxy-6-hydroxymethyldihydropteridine diphosphokinase n=1 Tax=Spelaeicoccus albus TaxID=1280376 RepID=A0A7Z0D5U1_9MICO|nr:2-amino-4-hydroxy-6-hydroxymethyldihydropteridine diphosphokinase [Spelaeicoccus albus]NYI69430.1 2-amino-4-hydroxy-6-hydroxymethyldihydropteridine diphosphokinase [Spelaeicoccus albus]
MELTTQQQAAGRDLARKDMRRRQAKDAAVERFGKKPKTGKRSGKDTMSDSVTVVLALGANLGDRADTLSSAVRALAAHPRIDLTGVSPVVETEPVGGPDQPTYLNAVVTADVTLTAHALLDAVHRIEAEHGRVRIERWGPRTLDIDIIDFGGTLLSEPDLMLPHPRANERAFVLEPWRLLDPDAVLPGAGKVADLAVAAADADGLRLRRDVELPSG